MREFIHLATSHAPCIWNDTVRVSKVISAAERAFFGRWKYFSVGTATIGLQVNGSLFVKQLAVGWSKEVHNVQYGLTRSLSELIAKVNFARWIQDSRSVWTNGALATTIGGHIKIAVGSHSAVGSEITTVIGNLGAKIVLILQACEFGARDNVVGKGHVASVGTERAVGLEEKETVQRKKKRSELETVGMQIV